MNGATGSRPLNLFLQSEWTTENFLLLSAFLLQVSALWLVHSPFPSLAKSSYMMNWQVVWPYWFTEAVLFYEQFAHKTSARSPRVGQCVSSLCSRHTPFWPVHGSAVSALLVSEAGQSFYCFFSSFSAIPNDTSKPKWDRLQFSAISARKAAKLWHLGKGLYNQLCKSTLCCSIIKLLSNPSSEYNKLI